MLRHATIEETQFYNTQLYPLMDSVMKIIQSDKFYLTGGTCLARHYFHHRYSDDLDFFFLGEKYSREEYELEFAKIAISLSKNFTSQITINADTYKRIMLKDNNVDLKLEFIYEPYPHIGELQNHKGNLIDTIENVAVNKLTAVQDRKAHKDFYDLMWLLKERDFEEMMKLTELKMIPMDYEGTLMMLGGQAVSGTVLVSDEIDITPYNDFVKELKHKILDYAKHAKRLF
jgi:predicted nucleotidyltransferase component of viral defense system